MNNPPYSETKLPIPATIKLSPETMEQIIETVCLEYRIDREDLFSESREAWIVEPRLICYYLSPGSITSTAHLLKKNRGTILAGRRRVKAWIDVYPQFRARVEKLSMLCKSVDKCAA